MDSPAKRMRLSASRTSLSGRRSIAGNMSTSSGPGTGASTSSRAGSASNTASSTYRGPQPTYDIITGEPTEYDGSISITNKPPSRPPSRQDLSHPPPLKRTQLRQSMLPKPATTAADSHQQRHQEEVISLRAKINSLDYELKNIQSERGLLVLQHEKELRDVQARSESDYNRYQNADSERLKAQRMYENATREVAEARNRSVNEKAALEKRLREAENKHDNAVEEKEDLEGRLGELSREYERFRSEEIDGKKAVLERTLTEVREEMEAYRVRFEMCQTRLEEKETEIERLEKKVLELNESSGGGQELDVLKRELSEQIAYVRKLEIRVNDQNSELRKLRDERRSVNVVEEEKRALEVQIRVSRETEQRLGELEIQKEILEDEKRTWTSLLNKDGEEGGESEFESPEAVVRALVNERIERAMLLDRVGSAETDVAGKDEAIRSLEAERNTLKQEVEKLSNNTTSPEAAPQTKELSDDKAYKRLEMQRQLAVKEVEYLRAQLKTLDAEEKIMMENNNFDDQRSEQIKQLEGLVDQYKSEIQGLHTDLTRLESNNTSLTQQAQQTTLQSEPRGTKRSADSQDAEADNDSSSQLGHLLRKNKNLQTALQKIQSQSQLLATELQATKSQLKHLRASRQTRVLELRDNPTSQFEAIKTSALKTLKAENQQLMTQLRGENLDSGIKVVPVSSLDALKLDLQSMETVVAEKEKRMRRQREIWTDKAAEFRDVISSVLGYNVQFLPNGKVKVSSTFYKPFSSQHRLSSDENNNNEEQTDPDESENYIMFDGEKGTMKISGGPHGQFGRDISDLVDFWVKGRRNIPLFLAACQIEFAERFTSTITSGEGVDGSD